MNLDKLRANEAVAGLLVDGIEGTPYTGAVLKLEAPLGVVLEVPYIEHDPTGQFTHVKAWFEDRDPPENMILETPDGAISLFGVSWREFSLKPGVCLGRLLPRETLLGHREAPIDGTLLLDEVRSRIDGLREWTGMSSLDFLPKTGDNGRPVGLSIELQTVEGETWPQGEATMQFCSEWGTSRQNDAISPALNIADNAVLVTRFPSPRPFRDHLAEQRKVANLLTLMSGAPIKFRQHNVSAPSIVSLSFTGKVLGNPKAPLFSVDTVSDFFQPPPSKDDLNGFLSSFTDIGEAGMSRWAAKHEDLERFIFPAVGVFGRKGVSIEDVVVSLSMSIEAAGQIIGVRQGEGKTFRGNKITTSTNVYRCLSAVGVELPDVAADNVALARAISNTYNGIKHYSRGDFPERDISHLVSVLARYIVRLVTLYFIDESRALLTETLKDRVFREINGLFKRYGITFAEDGKALRTTDRK